MNNQEAKNCILSALRHFGYLSFPEMLYLFKNHILWSLKLNTYQFLEDNGSELNMFLKSLHRKENIRRFKCESGYKWRYGLSTKPIGLDIPLKLKLKIKLQKCLECSSWVIKYYKERKHLSGFFCREREECESKTVQLINYHHKKFIIFKNLLLGVFENNKLRLPFRDFIDNIPELYIALKIMAKKSDEKWYHNLKLSLEEVLI